MGVTVGYASSKLWKSEYYYNIPVGGINLS